VRGASAKITSYTWNIKSRTERKEKLKIYHDWWSKMIREPLYRNQSELESLIHAHSAATDLFLEVYETLSDAEKDEAQECYEKFYCWPSIKKVYGIEIGSLEEKARFIEWVEARERGDEMQSLTQVSEGQDWSLDVPEDAEEFWEWFKDEKTGKPMPTLKSVPKTLWQGSISPESKDKFGKSGKQ
jgi:hypothetical protein